MKVISLLNVQNFQQIQINFGTALLVQNKGLSLRVFVLSLSLNSLPLGGGGGGELTMTQLL